MKYLSLEIKLISAGILINASIYSKEAISTVFV